MTDGMTLQLFSQELPAADGACAAAPGDAQADAPAQEAPGEVQGGEEADAPAREAALRQGFLRLKAQFAEVQARYPEAEFSRELAQPAFMRLIACGVDARSAYELTHFQELQRSAMEYGARRTREELAAAAQQGYLRPREGAMDARMRGPFDDDPARWSKQTRSEVKARARRGEKIRL